MRRDAERARKEEELRAARIRQGMGLLDALFDGGVYGVDRVADDAIYDPTATYYTADGRLWMPPTTGAGRPVSDEDVAKAFEDARRIGLYRNRATTPGFNDEFFNRYQTAFVNAHLPDLDKQFSNARDELTYALLRAGTLNSSVAGERQGDLTRLYNQNLASLMSQAQAARNRLRGRVAETKANLASLLSATGDVDRVANEALARSARLYDEQPEYNPLGDIFAGVAAGIGHIMEGVRRRDTLDTYYGRGRLPSQSHARIIR